jgi:hypothetical protein
MLIRGVDMVKPNDLPLVSIIVVNYNGIEFIDQCLSTIFNTNYPNFEVILIDNASRDGSLECIKKGFANEDRLRLIENAKNVGPAVAENQGSVLAKGKYIAFLDNDTEVDPFWLIELVKVLESDYTIGAAQSKLLNIEDRKKYDCAGDYLGPLGFLIERARYAQDEGQFDFIIDILSAKSAASIIRKDIIDRIGGFDEGYYMFLEETDLSWRVWLAGFRVVFIPNSIVYHAFGTSRKKFKRYYSKYLVRYYGCRNYISTLIKNLQLLNLIKILPIHIGCWSLLAIFFALKGNFEDTFYILKGIGWNIINLGSLLKSRHLVNTRIRKVKDSFILSRVMDKKEVGYYWGKAISYLVGRKF